MSANTYLPPTPVVPGKLLISAISRSYPMVVTIIDSIYNTYIAGQIVILTVPRDYGMFQANELSAKILSISGTDFSLDIDSRGFDAFVIPDPDTFPSPVKPASLAPGGSRNTYNVNVIPFRSLNNEGN